MSLKLNLDQVAGLAAELANNASFIAAMTAALANTNANVATVGGTISNTVASLATVSNSVTYMSRGYEPVQNIAIESNGALIIDLQNVTATSTLLNRNATITYVNLPPAGTRKTWTETYVGVGQANTVTHAANTVHNGGTAPTVNTVVGKATTITRFTDDGGVKIRSFKSGET